MCPISQIYIYRWHSLCNVRNDIDNWSYFIRRCAAVSIAFGCMRHDGYATWLRRRKIIVRFGRKKRKMVHKVRFPLPVILLRLHSPEICLSSANRFTRTTECAVVPFAEYIYIYILHFFFGSIILRPYLRMAECNLSVLGTDFARDLWYLKCVDTFSMNFR